MCTERTYTESEVIGILSNLVNGIGLCAKGDIMPERYKQKMPVNGKDKWVTGRTLKDLLEAYLDLCLKEGTVLPGFLKEIPEKATSPLTGEYIDQFISLYKTQQESNTKVSRDRTIKNHIKPKFGSIMVSEITVNDIQEWFNSLEKDGYSHESLLKIKNVFSPCLDSAVEDGYLKRNPFKSTRLKIGGAETVHHKAIPPKIMKAIRESIPNISDNRMKYMLALLSYTGMRIEEILGLRWEDIDTQNGWINIKRAVVHPTRNQPEIKTPKTKTSMRRIPLPEKVKKVLKPNLKTGFILYSPTDDSRETPLSYTAFRNIFKKIRTEYNLDNYTPHDFRDTCATEWREAGVSTDIIAQLLGHSKSDITETRYVKYRDEVFQGVRAVMNHQNGTK